MSNATLIRPLNSPPISRTIYALRLHSNLHVTYQSAMSFIDPVKFLASGLASWSNSFGLHTKIGRQMLSISLDVSRMVAEFEFVLQDLWQQHQAVWYHVEKYLTAPVVVVNLRNGSSDEWRYAFGCLDVFRQMMLHLELLWDQLMEFVKDMGLLLG
ncbi:hypothetical protein ACHAPJ_009633 [Fusarium lateritium]